MDIDRYAPAQKTDFDEIPIISLSGLDTVQGLNALRVIWLKRRIVLVLLSQEIMEFPQM